MMMEVFRSTKEASGAHYYYFFFFFFFFASFTSSFASPFCTSATTAGDLGGGKKNVLAFVTTVLATSTGMRPSMPSAILSPVEMPHTPKHREIRCTAFSQVKDSFSIFPSPDRAEIEPRSMRIQHSYPESRTMSCERSEGSRGHTVALHMGIYSIDRGAISVEMQFFRFIDRSSIH